MDRKWLSFPFECKETNVDNDYFTFKGYGSTFGNVDLGNDIVVKGAFVKSLEQRKPKLIWQHNIEQPIGVFSRIEEDSIGLYVEGKMPKDDSFVKTRIIPQLKIGSLDGMSIGFTVNDYEMEEGKRLLKKLTLWEISLVTLGMNPMARVTDMKGVVPFKDLPLADRDRAWDSTAAVRRIREFTDSTDEPSARYRNAFFWFDSEAPENFGSYKLPYADVIDGSLKAVPRGIFAVAGVLQGARGGVDIPESDIARIRKNVERYYAKMDLEAPWNKSISSIETIKDLSNYFKESGFSKNTTEEIMAKMRSFLKDNQGNPDKVEGNLQQNSENSADMQFLLSKLQEVNKIIGG